MKFFLPVTLAAAILSGCAGIKNAEPVEAKGKTAAVPVRQKQFFLPTDIYAVPGVESNIYFRNIFLTVNHANYVFDVTCPVGRNDAKRWRYTPTDKEAGKSYPLSIRVYDQDGLAAEGSTTLHVAPADAGKGRKVSLLIVGDSLTNATVYPKRLHELCQGEKQPKLVMIGSHCGGGRKPVPGGVAHEGYGGWAWGTFMSRYLDETKITSPRAKYYAKSKFLTLENGKPVFRLAPFLKQYNSGKTPDIVVFQLGVNDVFSATDANRDKTIASILKQADALIAAFRKDAPDALIGVGYVTPGSGQDSFGCNYKNGQTAWGYFQNQFRLNQAMAAHFAGQNPKPVMIPTQLNLDCENNFPARKENINDGNPEGTVRQCNGVHPANAGYRQMGDTYFAWLKYQLSRKKD